MSDTAHFHTAAQACYSDCHACGMPDVDCCDLNDDTLDVAVSCCDACDHELLCDHETP